MARAHRFWWGYAVAWLPSFSVFYFAFAAQGSGGAWATAAAAAANTLPDALLGTLVVHFCRRLWRRTDARRRGARLLASAAAFTVVASAAKLALTLLLMQLEGRAVTLAGLRGVVLWQAFFSLLACAALASVTFGLATAERLRAEEARRAQAELLRARAELKALRAQLEPHFLFNTLHSVQALVHASPDAAEHALEQLGDLARYALRVQGAEDEGVLLREEWEFVRAYLALERLRLGERLRVEEQASEAALESVVPALVLQPLVENAIRHGLGASACGGTLVLRAALEDGALLLEVRDDGPGAGETTRGTGVGLELVRQRLRALYGPAGSLTVASAPGAGFAVTLRFPATLESW